MGGGDRGNGRLGCVRQDQGKLANLLDSFYKTVIPSCRLAVMFACYQGARDGCGRLRQDAPGPDGTLHRGQHRQDGGQGIKVNLAPLSISVIHLLWLNVSNANIQVSKRPKYTN